MSIQPIAELFGFPIDNDSQDAVRARQYQFCPFSNKGPNCTKDSITNPLGVCSIHHGDGMAVICPVRLQEDWLLAEHAARFFFPANYRWAIFLEVRLKDRHGISAGNIDVVLVAYDNNGSVIDFGSLEVQTVYISGNIRKEWFQPCMDDIISYRAANWSQIRKSVPVPDYLSSSRKRLMPQLLYKGGSLNAWGKKQAVAVHSAFFDTLPSMPTVTAENADIAWLIYDIEFDSTQNRYKQKLARTVYTEFKTSLDSISFAEAGLIDDFMVQLQSKLTVQLAGSPQTEHSDLSSGEPDGDALDDIIENL